MLKEDIEILLKQGGWKRTESSPVNIVDYQRREPYNRLILYSEEFKYITENVLKELMEETDVDKKLKISEEAKEKYEGAQVKLVPTQNEITKVEELKLRGILKSVIDKMPVEKLTLLVSLIQAEFSQSAKALEGLPEIPEVSIKKEVSMPTKVVTLIPTGFNMTTVHGSNKEQTDLIEKTLKLILSKEYIYRSAVIINTNSVRAIECTIGAKSGGVVVFVTKDESDASELVFVLDGTLKGEMVIESVERGDEITLTVIYSRTGFRADWLPKRKRRFRYIETEEGRILVDETDKPIWEQRRRKGREE